jgi:hypothetical protein
MMMKSVMKAVLQPSIATANISTTIKMFIQVAQLQPMPML